MRPPSGGRRLPGRAPRARRRGRARRAAAEPQAAEQRRDARGVDRARRELPRLLRQRDVPVDRHQLQGEARGSGPFSIFSFRDALELPRARQHGLQRPELPQQLRGRLLADAGTPGTLSDGSPASASSSATLPGGDAEGLDDLLLGDLVPFQPVAHLHALRDELVHVLVGGDDDDVHPLLLRHPGEGADDVVRLDARQGHPADAERVDHLVDQPASGARGPRGPSAGSPCTRGRSRGGGWAPASRRRPRPPRAPRSAGS
jgi:hypothetical protein